LNIVKFVIINQKIKTIKKIILILLLTIPFVGFGQGWDFKLGTNLLIPFSNTIETWPDFNDSPIKEYTTNVGLSSSISYEYFINEKFSLYPSISYSFINYKTNERSGPFTGEYNVNDHFINVSLSPGYRINNKFFIYFGLSFDSKIKSTRNGTITYTPIQDSIPTTQFQDPIPTTQSYNWTSSDIELFYLSNEISLKYYIKKNVFIFSNLKIPLIYYNNVVGEFSWKKRDFETNSSLYQRNRYIVIGGGYLFNKSGN